MDNKTWVQAVIDSRLYPNMPGAIITLWGHDFKIYTDKSLCLKMDNEYVKNEIKAGRVKLMDTLPPGVVEVYIPDHKKINVIIEDPKFTKDVKTFYGMGNMNDLIEAVGKLTNPKIRAFVKDKFDESLSLTMNKSDMLEQIRTLTDIEYIKQHTKED